MLGGVGLAFLLSMMTQGWAFQTSGQRLAERVRISMFGNMLRQGQSCGKKRFIGPPTIPHYTKRYKKYPFGIHIFEELTQAFFSCRQEMGWFDSDKNNTGALCARLSSNAEAISGVAGAKVGQAISGLTTLFCGTGLALYYNWKLGLGRNSIHLKTYHILFMW